MTHVVSDNCTGCRFTECVDFCPVDAFHLGADMLYINPDTCIDCGVCVPECPVEAIYRDEDLPPDQEHWTQKNADLAEQTPCILKDEGRPSAMPGAEARKKELGF